MRKLALSMVVALAGCGSSGVWSPSDPKAFDRGMFDASAIDALPKEERPYVMGHAIGVYLYGKTLPGYVEGHYVYRPGKSSPHAEVNYEWENVLVARSGGTDGNGGSIYDDVTPENPHGPGAGSNAPGDPGESPPPTGGPDDVQPCGEIDATCDTFLGPAAVDARLLAAQVNPARFADADLSPTELTQFSQEFERGLDAALAQADSGVWAGDSEVSYLKTDAIESGICQH